jgi:hypothetical protein
MPSAPHSPVASPSINFEIAFQKNCGQLMKSITLAADGSACVMMCGAAQRLPVDDVTQFSAVISGLRSDQAIALGPAARRAALEAIRAFTGQTAA